MSKSVIILGDVHGNINRCLDLCKQNPDKTIVQLGDFGVGFIPTDYLQSVLPLNFKFFVGNHDNRTEAKKITNNLGDYGEFGDFFFVSGANSIDANRRIPSINWWHNEEISYSQAHKCLMDWEKSKKQILVCHDCPQGFADFCFGIKDGSLTRNLLQDMIDTRKPRKIIFGHHHKSIRCMHGRTDYVGLAIDEAYEIPV
jgi:predicted phosphodiesterase